jgi:hypothetical protein
VLDQSDDWIDHKPARSAEKRFIEQHGLAESRGGQYKYTDIELAAAHLREMLDTLMVGKRSTEQEHGSSI